ncbi:potassium-transporting ATPase subunit F [Nostoc sp. FACHB-152]|uniref:potassium-transporting ATPase subunit F n=1 Tax=unclassified Nostoc TaxID=2593658 RepID=UPI001682F738|nr:MULTISPECIES: potassium-transporting ATPase subunit F [unclassified Nostoc]MBD2448626.1 potassium-transporting ATPase subunit F [Nostoc sp. FACHB-152]MBD2468388.1 potassium-transporting ATPase subunit F [Nostoc sp. FACHB-145]
MKLKDKYVLMDLVQAIAYIWSKWCKQKLPLIIFTLVCLNLVITPVVYAVDSIQPIRFTWAYGVLGAIVLGLIIYLFVVIFLPERF